MLRLEVRRPSCTAPSPSATAQATPSSTGTLKVSQRPCEIRHAGAAEHDRLRPVLVERAGDFGLDAATRVRAFVLQRQHRNLGGAHARAAGDQSVFGEIALDRRDGARQGRDDAELFGHQPGHVKRRLANADHRRGGRATRGLQPSVVETGDDESVGVGALPISSSSPGSENASS